MSRYSLTELQEQLGSALHHYSELSSTSDEALRLVRSGLGGHFVVLADRQLAGRGRRGTSWFCDADGGLAFSLAMAPTLPRILWPRLALVAGLAVVIVLERRHFASGLKWPNDVLIRGQKVAGILAETEGSSVVFGFGINCAVEELPADLAGAATSLALESGNLPTREELLLEVVRELSSLLGLADKSFANLIQMARERCALTGESIHYRVGDREEQGICQGIGDGGELLVQCDGITHRLISAEQIRIT